MPAKTTRAPTVNRTNRSQRTRSNAQKRIDLANLVGNDSEASDDDPTMDVLLTAMGPFIPGMIETLGMAAQPVSNPDGTFTPGDTQAAKTVLEFLGKALANRGDRHSQDVLQRIAAIRKGGLEAALAEPDDEVEDNGA